MKAKLLTGLLLCAGSCLLAGAAQARAVGADDARHAGVVPHRMLLDTEQLESLVVYVGQPIAPLVFRLPESAVLQTGLHDHSSSAQSAATLYELLCNTDDSDQKPSRHSEWDRQWDDWHRHGHGRGHDHWHVHLGDGNGQGHESGSGTTPVPLPPALPLFASVLALLWAGARLSQRGASGGVGVLRLTA